MALTKIGATLGGSANIINVTQTSHTFVSNDRGKAVRMTDNSGTPQYVLAIASATTTADAIGIIVDVADGNNFTMATSGRITVDACIPSGAAGTVVFLSHATAGVLTSTEPSATGHVSKPMAVITVAGAEMIMLQQRGEVISSSALDAHTVAAHSDTSATGANLNTLVGGGATALHSHAIADGSVDNDAMADDAINTDEIVNDAVTYAKMQNLGTADRVLGSESTGVIGEVQIVPDMIAADAVTNAKLANMAAGTVKANATGSAANPTDVSLASASQATIAGDDVVLIYDTSATALATMTRTNFVAGIGGGPTEATQAVMEENTPGSSTANTYISPEVAKFHPGVASVWLHHDGNTTTAINASFGISSVNWDSNGVYSISFAADLSSTNYVAVATVSEGTSAVNRHAIVTNKGTGGCKNRNFDDANNVSNTQGNILIFGEFA